MEIEHLDTFEYRRCPFSIGMPQLSFFPLDSRLGEVSWAENGDGVGWRVDGRTGERPTGCTAAGLCGERAARL